MTLNDLGLNSPILSNKIGGFGNFLSNYVKNDVDPWDAYMLTAAKRANQLEKRPSWGVIENKRSLLPFSLRDVGKNGSVGGVKGPESSGASLSGQEASNQNQQTQTNNKNKRAEPKDFNYYDGLCDFGKLSDGFSVESYLKFCI